MIKVKKLLALVLTGVIAGSMLTGCSSKENKAEEKSNKTINVTYVKAPLNVPSIIEKNNKNFDKEFEKDNMDIKWHEITAGPQQTQALAAGELQFLHALGGTSAILAASNGVDLKIINVYSRAPKAFMIITKNDNIKNPKDLKGKKIAGPKGTVLHQLLVGALEKNGLKQENIEFVNMGIPEALAALNNKSVDAALLAGPAALKAVKSGAKIVANGEGIVEGTIVTAVSEKFLKDNLEIVKRFKKVHNETIDYIKNNFDQAMDITAKEVGLTPEETKQMYSWYDFDSTINEKDIEELKKTQDFMMKNGLQQKEVKIEDLIEK
ncbi:sulfonate transport system substrate-binding protein [Clostridium tetanomorphum]|uniref:Aliphatic sulfonate ABC transporter substrate-binding protein n=1 Tax=Clostridium tetanomorphum TaxID=1553 RepID=A0A923J1M5_CLOTT|nr:NrtA/SsuA/CpmA family ABC transporter substrate-binding protein [Clostridium tetanomorphum]KAJ51288.1 ABC transporter sulfonate-family extracellular solute-binding protein [Clostridium tetanomorphum DSM 665]MBC2397538.1 aliphatic sulfonate ABC transporter substrate-binding protein [Clostridium tetanomorphum]MBP1863635.1 sulfonate transport system substrate-binding protein [Clostridium tetanomorphum]NRS86211.1 sulfonate transport system substrate-binding protein [Clostridium tetanomorphum]NR